MDETKIYVITRSMLGGVMLGTETPRYFVLSKEEAEYITHRLNEKEMNREAGTVFFPLHYSYHEIPSISCDREGKEYKKFQKEVIEKNIEKTQNEIKDKKECAIKDEKAIEELLKKLEHYNSLKKN